MEGATPEEGISGEAADDLIRIDNSGDSSVEGRGQMRKDISNAMVGLKKKFYGRGPEGAKTFINDDRYVFCVLQGGLTPNERRAQNTR